MDIYLVDMRYNDNSVAARYSNCPDYVEVNREAVKEMHRQVEDLELSDSGIAERGVIIRHLVLPCDLSGTEGIFKFLLDLLSDLPWVAFLFFGKDHSAV